MNRLPLAAVGAALFLAAPARAQQRVPPEYVGESGVRWPDAQVLQPPKGYEEYDYHEGEDVPPGYEVETTFHRGLVGTGAVVFAFSYGLSVIAARVTEDPADGAVDPRSDESGRNRALYAPLIGPFIAAGQERRGAERALVIADGIAQAGGLALIAVGLTKRESKLVKQGEVSLVGMEGASGAGVAIALP